MIPEDPQLPNEQDDEEALRLENDILKLKMQAEFGAQFDEIAKDVSPELEQQFLKQVYDFEKAWEKQEITTVSKLLGNPNFIPINAIAAADLDSEYQKVLDLYEEKGMSVDFTNEYPTSVKYRFATEELPLHETMLVNMPGMMLGFIYEEFHPNHASDMEEKVKTFLEGWFDRDIEKCTGIVSKQFILDNGQLLPQESFKVKLQQLFDSYNAFEETDYFISETSYEKQEADAEGDELALGYVEGGMRWKAVLENGETLPVSGPFKFYLELGYGDCSIMYFVLPGWKW
ncbi:MAG: hypothetical protein V4717_03285 [Bacteroidota bacterium]